MIRGRGDWLVRRARSSAGAHVLSHPVVKDVGDLEVLLVEHHHVRHAEDAHLVQLEILRFRRALLVGAARVDGVDRVLAHHAGAGVVALEREVRDVVEIRRRQAAVRQRAGSLERHQSLEQAEMAALLQDASHVMTHDARLRVGDNDGAAEPLDQRRQVLRRPGVGGRDLFRVAGVADRTRQRHLGVWHQLLVVLERECFRRSGWRRPEGAGTRHDRGIQRVDREQRRNVRVGVRMRVRVGGVAVRDQLAGQDCRIRRHEVPEPVGPRAVVRDPAEAGDEVRAFGVAGDQLRFAFMDDGLVEARAAAAGLIDDVAGNALADEVGIPAFAAVGGGLQARSRVARAVNHDHGPPAVLLRRDLELHVHLADRDLVRRERLVGRRRRCLIRDLLHAADEEAALILDGQRGGEKLLRLLCRLA